MGGNYYYFCSQLPALQPGAVPPFTLAEFDERVAGILPPADFSYVSRCGFPPDRGADLPAGSVGAAYRSWEFALRGEIARLRVAEGHGDAIDLPPETDAFADIREQIGGAASAPNPLERERRVDQLRWRRLDELAFGHEFTVEAVACYRLRLAILEKNRQFVAETGRNNFEEAVGLIDRNSAE